MLVPGPLPVTKASLVLRWQEIWDELFGVMNLAKENEIFCSHLVTCTQKSIKRFILVLLVAFSNTNSKAYSHSTGTGLGQVQGMGLWLMGLNTLYRNVDTGPRQGKASRSTVSYCVGPVHCTCPSSLPVQCE